MNQEKIGKFIAKLRKDKNLTQQELADILCVTDKAVSKWENGRCLPDISILGELSKYFNVSINDLLAGEIIDDKRIKEVSEKNIIKTLNYSSKEIGKKNKYIKNIILSVAIALIISIIGLFFAEFSCVNYYKSNSYKNEIKNFVVNDDNINTFKYLFEKYDNSEDKTSIALLITQEITTMNVIILNGPQNSNITNSAITSLNDDNELNNYLIQREEGINNMLKENISNNSNTYELKAKEFLTNYTEDIYKANIYNELLKSQKNICNYIYFIAIIILISVSLFYIINYKENKIISLIIKYLSVIVMSFIINNVLCFILGLINIGKDYTGLYTESYVFILNKKFLLLYLIIIIIGIVSHIIKNLLIQKED